MRLQLNVKTALSLIAMTALFSEASPVTTVPWNGYKGAVTFTFDDGCSSQLTNVVPALLKRGIHATFFIPGFSTSSQWVAVAKNGNEIANHTLSHVDLTALSSDSATAEITRQVQALQALDNSIKVRTLAYPGCANNASVDTIANKYNIIARACGGDPEFAWNTKPSWMSMASLIVSDTGSYKSALADIADAAKNNKWMVTLNHGVGGDWMSVNPNQVESMFDLAIADSMWIDTYLNVAAYWRASFTMDTVHAATTATGWKLSWISPHSMMPTSVPLRVKLNATTFGNNFSVLQNGSKISPQKDGSYIIEFMNLQLDIQSSSSASSSSTASSSSVSSSSTIAMPYSSATIPGTIQAENYDLGGQGVAYYVNDSLNHGGLYRTDAISIGQDSATNGYFVGWMSNGEWLDYTVKVASAGQYVYALRVSSAFSSGRFSMSMDGLPITDTIAVPNTGSWNTYTTVTGVTKPLPVGTHTLRFTVDTAYMNVDWFLFANSAASLRPETATSQSQQIEYQVFDIHGKFVGEVNARNMQESTRLIRNTFPMGTYFTRAKNGAQSQLVIAP